MMMDYFSAARFLLRKGDVALSHHFSFFVIQNAKLLNISLKIGAGLNSCEVIVEARLVFFLFFTTQKIDLFRALLLLKSVYAFP